MAGRDGLRGKRLDATAGATQHRRRFHWGRFSLVVISSVAFAAGLAVIAAPRTAPPAVEITPVGQGSIVAFFTDSHRFVGSACVVGHVKNRTYLITAGHVTSSRFRATFSNFGGLRQEAEAEGADLVLVSVPSIFGRAWELGDPPAAGDPITCYGFFQGVPTETRGHVANAKLGWIDCMVGPGMSGGAVTNAQGELVGLVRATWYPGDMGMMVSIHDIKALVEEVP